MPRQTSTHTDGRGPRRRLGRRAGTFAGALAIGLPAAIGLTACGSSGSSNGATGNSGSPTTTKAPSGNGGGTSTSSLTHKADALCAQVSTASHQFAHLHLQTTTSLSSLTKTVRTDLHRIDSAVSHVKQAGHKKPGPIQRFVNEARTAVREGKSSMTQFEKGNFGTAKQDFKTAVNDLEAAKHYGSQANLRACL